MRAIKAIAVALAGASLATSLALTHRPAHELVLRYTPAQPACTHTGARALVVGDGMRFQAVCRYGYWQSMARGGQS